MKTVMMLTTTAYMSERFNRSNICILEEMGYEVHVVANFDRGNPTTKEVLEEFKNWIEKHHGKWITISVTKHPTDFTNNGKAYKQLKQLIQKYQYEFIHCHTPVAGVLGRLVGHSTKTKVIYTAHGFHFFKGAPLLNWLLYYPVERFLSRWTDILITINQEDYQRAKKSFHAKRTEYIPGVGVDTKKFAVRKTNKADKCRELGVPSDKFILLSVGELHEKGNQRGVLEALHKLKNPNIYYVVVGEGILKAEYEEIIRKYQLNNVMLLGSRTDLDELCEIADCFVHLSVREGLEIVPLEAMASGLPLISPDTNGVEDYTKDGVTGCCINSSSVDEICAAINKMYQDKKFRVACACNNLEVVKTVAIENNNKLMNQIDNNYSNLQWKVKHLERVLNIEILREELKFKSTDFIILSVGELNKNKNHEIIMRAIARIANPQVKYIICGQGILEEYLRVLSEELEISSQVRILGYRENIADYLYMADVFAFPSKREGLGLAAVEAMAAGLPLIGSDIHGIRDYLVDGITGYSFRPDSVEGVYSAVKRIYEDAEFRKKCGEVNRKTAKRFDMENCRKAMEKLYESQISC